MYLHDWKVSTYAHTPLLYCAIWFLHELVSNPSTFSDFPATKSKRLLIWQIVFCLILQYNMIQCLHKIPKAMHQKMKNIICQRSFNRESEKAIHSISTATKLHLYKSRFVTMLFEWNRFFWCCSKKPVAFAVLIK